jgi:hypothetical protein
MYAKRMWNELTTAYLAQSCKVRNYFWSLSCHVILFSQWLAKAEIPFITVPKEDLVSHQNYEEAALANILLCFA